MAQLLVIFTTIFLAELGDKTQVATLLYAADKQQHPVLVFLAASAALIAATALAVLVGTLAQRYLDALPLKLIAGLGFIAVGVWSLYEHFSGA
jgi:putative Ca2+/H+ antiporter (TMEM165/GDT1 family)